MSVKYINEYNSAEEYAADVRPSGGSSVSSIPNGRVYDGVNVYVETPGVGDAVVIDADNQIKFLKTGTINTSLLPSTHTTVGVVGYRFGNQVLVINKTNTSKKWADVYRWTVSGWSGYTSAVSVTLKADNGTVLISGVSFTPSGTTDAATFVSEFNTFLSTNSVATTYYKMYVETVNGVATPVLVLETYNNYQFSATLSGLTLTPYNGTEYTAGPSLIRNNMLAGSEGAIMNLDRAIAYFTEDLSASVFNPSSTVTGDTTYPVCLPGYLGTSANVSDKCAWLRNKYGEGYDGWIKYLKASSARFLTEYNGTSWLSGKTLTYAHVGKTYENASGVATPAYPAFEYCAAVGYNASGLEQGNWFLPSLYEMVPVWAQIKYGTNGSRFSDPINAGLAALGGSATSNGSNVWSSVRVSAVVAWGFFGNNGIVGGNLFYGGSLAVPCSLLKI